MSQLYAIHKDEDMLCKKVVNHCAPVLCGAKISNLVTLTDEEANNFCNLCRNTFLSTACLYKCCRKTVLLVYNYEALDYYIKLKHNTRFLKEYGYYNVEVNKFIFEVSKRFTNYKNNKSDFPHELGILLGYPIWDVLGFIKNKGENSLFTGYWKVYYELADAIVTFHKFDSAKKELMHKLLEGWSLEDIINDSNINNNKKAILVSAVS